MEWVTGDHHFYHDNIRVYCNRPFKDVWEMNAELERLWNANIQPGDVVWHLGDFGFAAKDGFGIQELFKRLHGEKILIYGSHDKGIEQLPWARIIRGVTVHHGITLVHDGEAFHRTHPEVLEGGGLVFCSHVHEIWKVRRNLLNVGVDVWHFAPVPWLKAAQYLQERFDYWKEHERI